MDPERASGPRPDAHRRRGEHGFAPAGCRGAGTIVVGPAVYAATKNAIEYRELPPLDLKGKVASAIAWEALRIKDNIAASGRAWVWKRAWWVATRSSRCSDAPPRRRRGARRSSRSSDRRASGSRAWSTSSKATSRLCRSSSTGGGGDASRTEHVSALADAIKAQCEILDDDPADVAAKKANAMVRELFGDDTLAPQHPRAGRGGRGAFVQPRGPVRRLAPVPETVGGALRAGPRGRPLGGLRAARLHRHAADLAQGR